MDITQVLTIFAIVATNLGTVLTIYFQTDKKIDVNRVMADKKSDDHRKETTAILNAIQSEIRDFHGKLCAIEERNRK